MSVSDSSWCNAVNIVQNADFERAAVKIQRGMEEELNRAEKAQVRRFLINDVPTLNEEKDEEEEDEAICLPKDNRKR